MLRDPALHVVYVTSSPVAEPIVDYYLSLLGPEASLHARERLTMISADDASVRPLSAKLLERPALLERIRRAIGDLERCHMVPLRLDRARAGRRRRARHPGPRLGPRTGRPRDQERLA